VDLLGEVVRVADLTDELELRLEPVGVFLLALEDLVQELTGALSPSATQRAMPKREQHGMLGQATP
jgi:hypothetical protein